MREDLKKRIEKLYEHNGGDCFGWLVEHWSDERVELEWIDGETPWPKDLETDTTWPDARVEAFLDAAEAFREK